MKRKKGNKWRLKNCFLKMNMELDMLWKKMSDLCCYPFINKGQLKKLEEPP